MSTSESYSAAILESLCPVAAVKDVKTSCTCKAAIGLQTTLPMIPWCHEPLAKYSRQHVALVHFALDFPCVSHNSTIAGVVVSVPVAVSLMFVCVDGSEQQLRTTKAGPANERTVCYGVRHFW